MARCLGLVWEKEPSNSLPKSRPSQVGLGAKGLSHTSAVALSLGGRCLRSVPSACLIAAESVTSAGVSDRQSQGE